MRAYHFLLIALLISFTLSRETKEWKRVADLPDYDESQDPFKMGGMGGQQQEQDPMKELEDIFGKLDPSGNKQLDKTTYKELLKDLILGAGRAEVEGQGSESIAAIQHKLIGSIIDEYVDLQAQETNTMQDLLEDLEQEKLLSYIDKVYKRKLDSMEL